MTTPEKAKEHAEKIAYMVRKIVDAAPPLTEAQRARLFLLLELSQK